MLHELDQRKHYRYCTECFVSNNLFRQFTIAHLPNSITYGEFCSLAIANFSSKHEIELILSKKSIVLTSIGK